jgi:hypothetical protein
MQIEKNSTFSSVAEVFESASQNSASMQKLSSKMIKLFKNSDCAEAFFQAMLQVLEAKKETSNFEAILQFLGALTSKLNQSDNVHYFEAFQSDLIHFILLGLAAANKVVRWRSSQVLATFINSIDELG